MNSPSTALPHAPETVAALTRLRRFMGAVQINILANGLRGEESAYFLDKLRELNARIDAMPKTYETDGAGDAAIAHLHYFVGGCDWYITERDCEAVQHQAFGLARLHGGEPELGYISIVELQRVGAELDWHFEPVPLAVVRRART